MITIRRASSADAAPLAILAEGTFRDTFAADNSPADMDIHCSRNFSAEIQLKELSDPLRVSILAAVDEKLVGFAQLLLRRPVRCLSSKHPAELNRLYVLGEWHGRRVAHQLMNAVLSTAAEKKTDHVWLGVWERNPRAMAFYRKFGFEVVGEQRFVLGRQPQRDLLMAVQINASSSAT
jgi:diamine N-acetyltransferase